MMGNERQLEGGTLRLAVKWAASAKEAPKLPIRWQLLPPRLFAAGAGEAGVEGVGQELHHHATGVAGRNAA
jgi:hypothetical protein